MAITALYRKYFQKSKIFLYPLLDIKRGTSVIPTETYVSWNDTYSPEDMKLICVYPIRSDNEFITFQQNVLFKHNRLYEYSQINDNTIVFVFDFSDLKEDWNYFLDGKYSKLKIELRRKILAYFQNNSGNFMYVESYLFPEKHFKKYSELLDVDELLLKSVGELCNKPDLQKEKLVMEIVNLENLKFLT